MRQYYSSYKLYLEGLLRIYLQDLNNLYTYTFKLYRARFIDSIFTENPVLKYMKESKH